MFNIFQHVNCPPLTFSTVWYTGQHFLYQQSQNYYHLISFWCSINVDQLLINTKCTRIMNGITVDGILDTCQDFSCLVFIFLVDFMLSILTMQMYVNRSVIAWPNPISVRLQISNLDTLASPIDSTFFWSIYSTCSFHYLPRDFIPFVLKHYGQSLQFGNKFIYQSMPRLLTIWLDFGATVSDQGNV